MGPTTAAGCAPDATTGTSKPTAEPIFHHTEGGERNYTELVLTGGPCAGKSTGLAYLREMEESMDLVVLTVPEMATIVHESGLPIDPSNTRAFQTFQEELIRSIRALRASYQRLALSLAPRRVLIVYDRAEADSAAYIGDDAYSEILAAQGVSRAPLRDSYDAVFHLVTAAEGAPEAYTTANNAARRETPEQAIEADRKTLRAWLGHPHLRIIDNRGDFANKMNRLVVEAARLVGAEGAAPVEIERKLLLAQAPPAAKLAELAHRSHLTQIYIAAPEGAEHRIRERTDSDGSVTRTLTEKRDLPTADGEGLARTETERLISEREFQTLARGAISQLQKTRWVFAHQGQILELDQFEAAPGREEIWVLEAELSDPAARVEVPEWIEIARDVSADPAYRSSALAR